MGRQLDLSDDDVTVSVSAIRLGGLRPAMGGHRRPSKEDLYAGRKPFFAFPNAPSS
ncbi:hypothetical protein MES5069_520153 [Mesorhizobium escarrei]|uniref:Uncharacterized protein n=1 Tax=Mesorhizobium escarrei TaxID=666018 RepID=A0ABM9ECG1_9HYPH|nr:hypothetical protein MES5069_520153 [Mesorhizobium escarrei]